jgi:hypothetical protein
MEAVNAASAGLVAVNGTNKDDSKAKVARATGAGMKAVNAVPVDPRVVHGVNMAASKMKVAEIRAEARADGRKKRIIADMTSRKIMAVPGTARTKVTTSMKAATKVGINNGGLRARARGTTKTNRMNVAGETAKETGKLNVTSRDVFKDRAVRNAATANGVLQARAIGPMRKIMTKDRVAAGAIAGKMNHRLSMVMKNAKIGIIAGRTAGMTMMTIPVHKTRTKNIPRWVGE